MARVLVVENDPLAARQIARTVGEELGHTVEVATSAAAARAACADAIPDELVIDYRLSGTGEGELVAELRARDPYLAVVVTTSPVDLEATERALAMFGPLGHVTRPVAASELLPRLHAALLLMSAVPAGSPAGSAN